METILINYFSYDSKSSSFIKPINKHFNYKPINFNLESKKDPIDLFETCYNFKKTDFDVAFKKGFDLKKLEDSLKQKQYPATQNKLSIWNSPGIQKYRYGKIIYKEPKKLENKVFSWKDLNLHDAIYDRDLIHPFSENVFFYSYKLLTYTISTYIYSDYYNFTDKLYASYPYNFSYAYTLFLSVILDQFYTLSLLILPYFNEFFKHFFMSSEFNTYIHSHPELYLIVKNYLFQYLNSYFSNVYMSMYMLHYTESGITIVMMFWHMFILLFLWAVFSLLYFCYVVGFFKANGIIDHDYLLFSVVVEAEEEIASIDDMLMASVMLIYIFFWFFWVNGFSSIIVITVSLLMTISLFPLLYFLILFIPFSLLYDYGSYFLTYLNGVGKSFLLIIEMVFDYIAVSIFFLRLTVQNVRLAFMLFTFVELHELILNTSYDENLLIGKDSAETDINGNKSNSILTFDSNYLFLTLPIKILNWLYELFHTFFMLLFQFVAFFAMIFWLFLFLYTMFITEVQENYLTAKRRMRKIKSKLWLKFKSNKIT